MREIIKTTNTGVGYHHCDVHNITISGLLDPDIKLIFKSVSRDDTSCSIILDGVIVFDVCKKYAAKNSMYLDVMRELKSAIGKYDIYLTQEARDIIIKCIADSISKCESRYGSSVIDYGKYDSDALIIIKGEDDSKPKYRINFTDDSPDVEELPEPLKGFIKEDEWLIHTDSVDLDQLVRLILEYDKESSIEVMIDPESKEIQLRVQLLIY